MTGMYGRDSSGLGSSPVGPVGDGVAGPAARGSMVSLGDNSHSADIVEQARGREDGFDYGDDRAIGNPPNWASQESTQLYRGATTNNEPATAEALGQQWTHHSQELQRAANDLYTAIAELGSAWIGEGAASAQGSLVAIANSSAQAGTAADVMGNRLVQQAAAAAQVKKMPAPKEFDPGQQTAAMLAGGPAAMTADLKVQADAAKDVKAQQVQYFEAYTKAMSEVDGSTPSFTPASLGLKPPANVAAISTGSATVGAMPGSSGGVGGGSQPGVYAVDVPGGAPVAASSSSPGSAAPAAHTAAAASGPATGAVSGAGAGTASAAPQVPQAPVAPGNTAQALGGAAVGGALGFAGAKTLSAGNRSGTRSQSSETAASAQGQANSASGVAPPQQGVVPAGGTIGGVAGPPPMAGSGMGGGMGGGMAGGARGQQQQEEEHTHASFLIEADPDDAFGANEATPPPVIGAWAMDEER